MRLRRWIPALLPMAACGPLETPEIPDPSARWGHMEQAVQVCAGGATVDGSDVSSYQGTVGWPQVAASPFGNFAYAKATEGLGYVDPDFAANWSGMKAAGIHRGAYHFYHCVTNTGVREDPSTEAADFVNAMGPLSPGDLPPMLDMESTTRKDPNGVTIPDCTASNIGDTLTFLQAVQSASGYQPIVYTYPSFLRNSLPSGLGSYPLWIANYGVTCPDVPPPWSNWVFWQYSSGINVPGENCGSPPSCDVDHYNGDRASLDNWTQGTPDAGSALPDAGTAIADSGTTSRPDSGTAPDAGSSQPDGSPIGTPPRRACGCSTGSAPLSVLFVLGAGLFRRRRPGPIGLLE
jgi:lysozyme